MTSRIQTNRFTTTGSRPPSTRPVGELAINFADNQISVTDPTPAARDILPIRFHSVTAAYLANDIVRQGTALYQAKANTPAHAFNVAEWNQFLTNVAGDARWLPLVGGTMTGLLTLSGPPTSNLHATTKLYVDAADATKVPLAGGTMTGFLTLSGPPTSNLHAATKLYVDGQVGLYLPLAGGTLTGPIESTSFIVADGDIHARGGHYFLGADDGAVLYSLSTTVALRFSLDGWALTWNRPDGTLSFNNNLALSLFNVDPFGNGNFAGAIHASNVTLLEEQINHLQARVAALEGAAP